MRSRYLRPALVVACAALLWAGGASAAVIHQFSTTDAALSPDDGYSPAAVSVTVGANVAAPANGAEVLAGNVGLARFFNTEWAGFSLSSKNGNTLDATKFATGYLTWAIAAQPGYELNLNSLQFQSARGGTSGTRGFALYAQINGGAFDLSDTPILAIENEATSVVRTSPLAREADLSSATYQGIDSITFRYYPLTPSDGNTMDFANMTLNGEAVPVPEPASLTLLVLGAGTLLRRRIR